MTKDLTVGKPETVLWNFCIPLFGSVIFQQLYNLADSFVAGKFIGENALASVGNSYEITLVFIAFAFGCNIGCSVIVSQFFGAKSIEQRPVIAHKPPSKSYAVPCSLLAALRSAISRFLVSSRHASQQYFTSTRVVVNVFPQPAQSISRLLSFAASCR